MTKKKTVVFRCDGSPEIGIGHITRCMALAEELQSRNTLVCFAMRGSSLGIRMVKEKGYQVISSKETGREFDYAGWLKTCVRDKDASAIILDVRDGLSRSDIRELRDYGILVVTIDDPEKKRLEADMAFYPPVPQVKRMDWTGFTGKLYSGWEWVILRPEFAERQKKQHGYSLSATTPFPAPYTILITMGGSDPAGMTLKAIEAIDLLDENFETLVLLGAAFCHTHDLNDMLRRVRRHFDVRRNVADVSSLMAQADLALASFGVTAYELAAKGVPAIHLCLTPDHAESANAFVEAGMAVSLGVFNDVSREKLAGVIKSALHEPPKFARMAQRGRQLIDGQGTVRIAQELIGRIKLA